MIPGNDYIVVDTPARPESDDLKELASNSDLLILPTTPDVVSLRPMLMGVVKSRWLRAIAT